MPRERFVPASPQSVAQAALRHAERHLDQARTTGVAVRLGVDGALTEHTLDLGDLVAATALAAGVPAVRVHAADFLNRRSVRLEHGEGPEQVYERGLDSAALRREVLEPVADPARLTWLPRLRDRGTDRGSRVTARTASPGTLLVLDGAYLLRPELAGLLEVSVHLRTAPATLHRALGGDDHRLGAWARYLDLADPEARATLLLRNDHPDRPALLAA